MNTKFTVNHLNFIIRYMRFIYLASPHYFPPNTVYVYLCVAEIRLKCLKVIYQIESNKDVSEKLRINSQ